ncbi:hypothetical protein H6P81_017482 [Aristolochia fimbriata]|uniref:NTF2 domain-containing protein n=1 Tax=Aristolochia fimbriata TaxID=158543 RepID=A0AAV7DZ33_ARIFI|nr:hypothetical protein H6P81_017482 [Aristolochia fimbriata]
MASELHPLDNSTTDPPNIISAQNHAETFVSRHHYSETMKLLREGGYVPLGRDRPVFKSEDIDIEKVNGRFVTDNVEDGNLLVIVWGTIILPGTSLKKIFFQCFFVEILQDNDYLVRNVEHEFFFNIDHARPPYPDIPGRTHLTKPSERITNPFVLPRSPDLSERSELLANPSVLRPKWPRLREQSELNTNQVKPADGPHLKELPELPITDDDEEEIEDDDIFSPSEVRKKLESRHVPADDRGKEKEDEVLSSSVIKKKMESLRQMGITPAGRPKYKQAAEDTPKHNARAGTPKKHTSTTQPAISGSNQRRRNAKSTIGASSLKDIQGYHPAIFDPVILELEQQNWLHHEMDHRRCTIYKLPDIMLEGEEDNNVFLPTYLPVSARYPEIADHIFDGMRRDHYFFHVSSLLSRNKNRRLEDYILEMKRGVSRFIVSKMKTT